MSIHTYSIIYIYLFTQIPILYAITIKHSSFIFIYPRLDISFINPIGKKFYLANIYSEIWKCFIFLFHSFSFFFSFLAVGMLAKFEEEYIPDRPGRPLWKNWEPSLHSAWSLCWCLDIGHLFLLKPRWRVSWIWNT